MRSRVHVRETERKDAYLDTALSTGGTDANERCKVNSSGSRRRVQRDRSFSGHSRKGKKRKKKKNRLPRTAHRHIHPSFGTKGGASGV